MSRVVSTLEILIGSLLLLWVAILLLNTKFCFFNQGACGMVEPVLALYMAPAAVSLLAAGFLHRRGKVVAGAVAYVPVVAIVVLLVGQARHWW